MKRDETELKNAVNDQLLYITNSCFLYDKGCLAEAIRIAAALNVLLEKRKKSSGLLRSVDYEFRLLSTVPDIQEIPLDKLEVSECESLDDVIDSTDTNKYNLTQIKSVSDWHLQAFDSRGYKISCLIGELRNRLIELNLLSSKTVILLPGLIRSYDGSDSFNRKRVELIIQQLDALLGYKASYATGFYFPMIDKKTIFEHVPKLAGAEWQKFLNLEDWLNEIIFAIPDETRENHTLTRKQLIDSARDQDGGGHFDIKLDVASYFQSKYGQKLGIKDGQEITTRNFHLIMLRQLGFEILNSPTINNYVSLA